MRFSFIIPVYNRPQEVDELLESLCGVQGEAFEVVVAEDGSTQPCKEVVDKYLDRLYIRYFTKPNSGPGPTRNEAAKVAAGEWLIFLDSDTLIPPDYLSEVAKELAKGPVDAFGGPDRAHEDFTPVQKAISYSMTSFFTTGGIRGSNEKLDKFHPRSFNMGIRKDVFEALKGFSLMRFGEDIDLSIRIFEAGYHCRLFSGAWVYHKRRTDFRKFFRQVFNSGIARIVLQKKHPGTLKLVHLLPALFTIGTGGLIVLSLFWPPALLPLIAYALLIFFDSLSDIHGKAYHGFLQTTWACLKMGTLSVIAAFVQLIGYGCGFIFALGGGGRTAKKDLEAFNKEFYK